MRKFSPDALRIVRESRNLSREKLAEMMGGTASRQVVHAWETGKYIPNAATLATIVNVLNLKSIDIFFTTDDHHHSQQ